MHLRKAVVSGMEPVFIWGSACCCQPAVLISPLGIPNLSRIALISGLLTPPEGMAPERESTETPLVSHLLL